MTKIWIASLVLGCIAACAVESPSPEDRGPQEAQDTTAQASTNVDMTWRLLLGPQDCRDQFGRSCTSMFPAPQCPAGTHAGTPCFVPAGTICYQTIHNGREFNAFQCF